MGEQDQTANILIVDDVSANLVVLSQIVKELGYIARPVVSVKQAMQAIEASLPQLILLDISMPEIDGYEYCEMLKKDVRTRDIPVIFISAMTKPEDKVKGFKLGAVDFIERPFEPVEVNMRINTHIKNFRVQQELESYNKRLHKLVNEQVQKIALEQKQMIKALSKISETRDDNAKSHIKNISANCRMIATCLQLSPKFENQVNNLFIDNIEVSCTLHDIGKILIPDRILLKPGRLSDEEMNEVMQHAQYGADLLKDIYSFSSDNDMIKMAIEIAQCHHEKWDGTGYPNGLKGNEIPLSARIMAIADVYDVLTGERCYKQQYSHEESMRILKEESGKSFDPDIVDIVLKVQKQLVHD